MNGFDWGKDTVKEKNLAEWIKSQHPDVVSMQELCGFTQEKLKLFAKSWRHNYAVILKEDGYRVGITSNQPITVVTKIIHDGFGHGMLHKINLGIHFFGVHMNPGDFKMREAESKLIRSYMKNVPIKNEDFYVVLGDFNAQSVTVRF